MTTATTREGELAMRLVGGVWGHLVGDAIGVPYEFQPAEDIGEVRWGKQGTHRQPPGTWSDDGALMLALLDSLTAEGVGFDVEDQGRRALAWRKTNAYTPDRDGAFDIGNTTRAALHAIEAGTPAADAGPSDIRNCGNGSLMRILPVALVGRDHVDGLLIDQARAASRVTHGHPRAQIACAVYVLVAVRLLKGESDRAEALSDAIEAVRGAISEEPDMVDALDHLLGVEERSGRGAVWDSFWSAWDAFAGSSPTATTRTRRPPSPAGSPACTGASTASPTIGWTACVAAMSSCRWWTRCSRPTAGRRPPVDRCASIGCRQRQCPRSGANLA
jgi:hypothetical protein